MVSGIKTVGVETSAERSSRSTESVCISLPLSPIRLLAVKCGQHCKTEEKIIDLNRGKEISSPLVHQKQVVFLTDSQNMMASHILLCLTPSTSYFTAGMHILCLKSQERSLDGTTMNASFPVKKRRKKSVVREERTWHDS